MPETTDCIRIELRYFEGCPSYKTAWSDLLDVITESGIDACIRPVNVDSPERAETLGFAGSPSITIEGKDLEGYRGPSVMACRVYRENEGRGWPSKALLKQRLKEASARAPTGRTTKISDGAGR